MSKQQPGKCGQRGQSKAQNEEVSGNLPEVMEDEELGMSEGSEMEDHTETEQAQFGGASKGKPAPLFLDAMSRHKQGRANN